MPIIISHSSESRIAELDETVSTLQEEVNRVNNVNMGLQEEVNMVNNEAQGVRAQLTQV